MTDGEAAANDAYNALYGDGGDDNSHNVDDEKGTSSAQFVIPN